VAAGAIIAGPLLKESGQITARARRAAAELAGVYADPHRRSIARL